MARPGGPEGSEAPDRPDATLSEAAPAQTATETDDLRPEPERVAVAEPELATSVEGGLPVRIVTLEGEQPVAGAEVFAAALGEDLPEAPEELGALDAWIEEHGHALRSDEQGLVAVPRGERKTLVVARSGELWGRATLPTGGAPPPPEDGQPEPHLLTLAPDATLTALVVDPAGAPVSGVPLELKRVMNSWKRDVAQETTGADGRATFAHVQAHRTGGEEPERWELQVAALLEQPLVRPVDPTAVPAEPVRFVLPATGSVRVRVRDAFGAPWLRDAQVVLSIIRPGERREISPFSSNKREQRSRNTDTGEVRFERVGLGLELAASVTRLAGQIKNSAYGPGPQVPGQEAALELAFGTDHPVVQVRLFDADGLLAEGQSIRVRTEAQAMSLGSRHDQWPVTDAEGRVRFDVNAGFAEGDTRIATLKRGPRDEPTDSARLDLSRKLAAGLHDLGDLTLRPPQVFVAGRVGRRRRRAGGRGEARAAAQDRRPELVGRAVGLRPPLGRGRELRGAHDLRGQRLPAGGQVRRP